MGKIFLLTKPIKFGVNWKKILCWSIFAIEPLANFCPFLGYWHSENASLDRGIKSEFISLIKPILLCSMGERILCWSLFTIESIAVFCPYWGYWPSENGWHEHDVNGEFVSLAKTFVFGTAGKRINNCHWTHSWF